MTAGSRVLSPDGQCRPAISDFAKRSMKERPLLKWTLATGAVLALCLTGCSDTEAGSPAASAPAATNAPVSAPPSPAVAAPQATAPRTTAPRATAAAPSKKPAGVNLSLFGRIELLAPGKIIVTPTGGAGQAAFLADDSVLLVAYGKCPDGSGTDAETVDAAGRGTKKCTINGLETWLGSNPLSGDVTIRNGVAVKIVEHKGG